MIKLMKQFLNDQEGQDLVEYVLFLVLLGLAAISVRPTLWQRL